MTITSGFYNSLNGDRKYNASQLSSLFDGIITDGIFMSIGTAMVVAPNSGMNISVGIGRAWFNKSWINNDAIYGVTVDLSEIVLDRIDAVVIEINASSEVRANTIKMVKGTPASTPVAPTLLDTEEIHQYPLALISVPANVTSITAGMITNKVGSVDCPFITGIIDSIDTGTLMGQFESDFMDWFDEMKGQLSTDAAGNLQNQIDALPTKASSAEIEVGTDDFKYITAKGLADSVGIDGDWMPEEMATETALLALSTSYQDLVPAPVSGLYRVNAIELSNEDSGVSADFFFKIVRSGTDYTVVQVYLNPGEQLTLVFPWNLNTETKVQAKVSVSCAGVASASYGAFDREAALLNFTGSSWTTLFTASSKTFIEGLLLVNNENDDQTLSYRIIDGSLNQKRIKSKRVSQGSSWFISPELTLPIGYAVQVQQGAAEKTGSVFMGYKEL